MNIEAVASAHAAISDVSNRVLEHTFVSISLASVGHVEREPEMHK
jgi:hypothetical protein